ncbi:MAG TPA: tRNA (cytidine(34)-2'-O)-methyltransferase [Desulfobacterales bacterium]|nr:tRNA (cytidine(34)-2'-O)-methyltransferase [Desulfobacterales bacterium]
MKAPLSRSHRRIKDPVLHVALYQPEIPANTGNIARLCAAAMLPLHLIHPLGFSVDDKHLRRAGLDYWPEVDVRHHSSLEAFLEGVDRYANILCLSVHCSQSYTEAKPKKGDYLLFGPETRGLPPELRNNFPCFRIPIWGKVRSLNLSTAVGIVTYHFLHVLGLF